MQCLTGDEDFSSVPVIRNSSSGIHVELPGKGPLACMVNGTCHDLDAMPPSLAAATAAAVSSATSAGRTAGMARLPGSKLGQFSSGPCRRDSRGSAGAHDRAERRPHLQAVVSPGASVSTTAGSGDIFSVPAPMASPAVPLVTRRTSGPRSSIKTSGGRNGTASPARVLVVTAQHPYARPQSSSIDLPLRSHSRPSTARSGSPLGSAIANDTMATTSSSLGHSQSIPQVVGRMDSGRAREQAARRASYREPARSSKLAAAPVHRLSLPSSREVANAAPSPRHPPGAPLVGTSLDPSRAAHDPVRALSVPPPPSSGCSSPAPSMIPTIINVAAPTQYAAMHAEGYATPRNRRVSPCRGASSRSPSPRSPHPHQPTAMPTTAHVLLSPRGLGGATATTVLASTAASTTVYRSGSPAPTAQGSPLRCHPPVRQHVAALASVQGTSIAATV
jgi:hypothetical protein